MRIQIEIPPCVSAEKFEKWRDAAGYAIPKAGFCGDCLPEYQRDMMRVGKCSHPEIRFLLDEDGFMEGVSPTVYRARLKKIAAEKAAKDEEERKTTEGATIQPST